MSIKPDQQEILERMQQLSEASGGRLTPQAVVDDAKDPASPLHAHFTWDVNEAAAERWLDQARTLIRTVHVTFRTEHTVVRAPYYVRDPSATSREPGYVAIKTLRTEADMAREAVVNEFSRAADVLRRAKNIAKALSLDAEVEDLISDVIDLRDRVSEGSPQAN